MFSAPFLSAAWIEAKMQKAGAPFFGESALCVESFLARGLGVDLDLDASLPDDVWGEVVFECGKTPRVAIGRAVSLEGEKAERELRERPNAKNAPHLLAARGRFRMTLAHEAAHIVLHRPLFEACCQNQTTPAIHRFYKVGETEKSALNAQFYGEMAQILADQQRQRARLEWQANRGASALLMPAHTFRGAAANLARLARKHAPQFSTAEHDEWISLRLADHFGASLQAVVWRKKLLGIA